MAELLTQAKFANLCNVSRQAVSKAVRAERIYLTRGKVDPEHPTNKYFRDQAEDRKAFNIPIVSANGTPPGPKSNRRGRKKNDSSPADTPSAPAQLDLTHLTRKYEIDAEKSREMTRRYRIENEAKRGELVSRDTVRAFLSKLYSIETSEFHTIGDRLGQELASLAGIEDPGLILQFEKAIKKEVSKTLDHIENEIDGYLRGLAEGAAAA